MLWSVLALAFFAEVISWVLSGFVGGRFSLSMTLYPTIGLLILIALLRTMTYSRTNTRYTSPTKRTVVVAGILVLVWTVVSWGLSGMMSDMPVRVRLFTLAGPALLMLLQVLCWTAPLSGRTLKRVTMVFILVVCINAVVTAGTFILTNWLDVVPPEVFWLNPRYPVILMRIGGRAWVRTPGIFESGGTNGSFLILGAVLSGAYALFGASRWRAWWWVGAGVQASLVLLTLTRRSMLALVIVAVTLAVLKLVRRRRGIYGIAAVTAVLGLSVAFVAMAPGVANSQSLFQRLTLWGDTVSHLYAVHYLSLIFGFGVTQAALPYLTSGQFLLADNMYLSLVTYGGVIYCILVVSYFILLFIINLRESRYRSDVQWLAVANVALIIGVGVIGSFSVFIFNATEALPMLIALNLSSRFIIDRGGAEGAGGERGKARIPGVGYHYPIATVPEWRG